MYGLSLEHVPGSAGGSAFFCCLPAWPCVRLLSVRPSPLNSISDVNPMGAKQGTPGALRGHVSSCSSRSSSRSSRSRASRCLWRGWDAVQWYLLSPHFQLGVQLAGGIIITSLPVFVRALRFPHACFSCVLMVICLVSMSPDGHLGTKLLASYQLLGEAWLGALTAGAMVSIAKPLAAVHQGAYIALLCITSCLGLGLLTSARAGPAAITLWPNITISCLNFAVVVLWSQSTPTLAGVWREDVGGMCCCGLTAAVAVILVSSLLLPSVATEEVVRLTSAAVRGAGHSLSRYLSLLLDTSAHTQHTQHHDSATSTGKQQQQQQLPQGDHPWASAAAAPAPAPAGAEEAARRSPAGAMITTDPTSSSTSNAQLLGHAVSGGSSIVVDARDLLAGSSSTHSSPASRRRPMAAAAAAGPAAGSAPDSALAPAGSTGSRLVLQQPPGAALPPPQPAPAAGPQLEHSTSIQFAPEHSPVQLLPMAMGLSSSSPKRRQQGHSHEHKHGHLGSYAPEHHHNQQLQQQHLGQCDGINELSAADQQQQEQDHHLLPGVHLHRGQHALHFHERHHYPHASVLPTPSGPVAVLGPSVDELRRLLMASRTALLRGAYEPSWCGACNGGPAHVAARGDATAVWRELLAAAEQLVNVVSTLQDVLVYASPRLLHPSTAISTSLASFSATAQAVIGLTINSTAQLAEVLLMPHIPTEVLAERASLAAASWAEARTQLEVSRAAAVQHYWASISSNSGKLVAASSEALAVMFVWVAVGGVMGAVERLDVAGSRLLGAAVRQRSRTPGLGAAPAPASHPAGAGAGSCTDRRPSLIFGRQPSKLGLEARHIQQQHKQQEQADADTQQQHPQDQPEGLLRRLSVGLLGAAPAPQPPLPRHHTPTAASLRQQPVAVAAGVSGAPKPRRPPLWKRAASAVLPHVLLLAVLSNMAGFWRGKLQQLASRCRRAMGQEDDASTQRGSWLQRLQHNRSAAAALKLWLGMSGLVVLFILVAENPGGTIHPTVAYAVMTVPTHGVIALVLAWHERVESTFIRVFLRITGTAAGGTVGWAALHATTSPFLLLLIMCTAGMLIAPLASASLHFRFATALTVISMLVVVLCQFDPDSGESRATDAFYGTRLLEVTVACLWAAFFNKLLLPWSTRDWSLEQLSAALGAAAEVLSSTSSLQFQATAAQTPPSSSSTCEDGVGAPPAAGPSREQLAAALLQQESALQKRVIEPVVAVQTAISMETHVWRQRSAPKTLPKPLRQLVRDTLLLADRITAVQVAVAALPTSSSSGLAGTSSSGYGSPVGPTAVGDSTAGGLAQQQDGGLAAAAGGAVGGNADAAERSVQYVVSVLTRPLHQSHQQQLQLVAAVASAVQQVLLAPSPGAAQQLQQVLGQLEGERESSTKLIAQLRKQLHHDVMHMPQQQHQHDTHPAHPDQQQQQGHPATQHAAAGVDGAASPQQADRLVHSLSVAMSSDGVLPVVGGAAHGGSGLQTADVAVHISRWWWVHAGEHYCQLLAFQYAFDCVVVGVLAVAHTALSL